MAQDLYRNRDFIPDFDAIMAETAARSRALSARATLRADLPYGPGPRERMDVILPPQPRPGAPLNLFIHGGYWRSGCKQDHHLVAAPVLAAGGICALVGYDLMPQTRLATIIAQVRAAAAELVRLAPALGADPSRLTVSGHSAGAHLACYLAAHGPHEQQRPALPPVQGLLLVSGLYDLSDIPDSFLRHETAMTPAEAADWSPVTALNAALPPRIITCGGRETQPFHDQAEAFSGLLRRQSAPVIHRKEPQCNHLDVVLALANPKEPLGKCLATMVACS